MDAKKEKRLKQLRLNREFTPEFDRLEMEKDLEETAKRVREHHALKSKRPFFESQ
jgi:hypothetical protein